MDIAEFLRSINTFDLLTVLILFAFFLLGFMQGTIRRLLGIASILFSFFLAVHVRAPLGGFLASNWTYIARDYSYMVGFGTVFTAATIAFTVLIQGFYRKTTLFEKATFVDEIIGGILGVLQALILIGAMIIILDTFFRVPGIAPDDDEFGLLRSIFDFYNGSQTAVIFRDNLVPGVFAIVGGFIPGEVRAFFPGA